MEDIRIASSRTNRTTRPSIQRQVLHSICQSSDHTTNARVSGSCKSIGTQSEEADLKDDTSRQLKSKNARNFVDASKVPAKTLLPKGVIVSHASNCSVSTSRLQGIDQVKVNYY